MNTRKFFTISIAILLLPTYESNASIIDCISIEKSLDINALNFSLIDGENIENIKLNNNEISFNLKNLFGDAKCSYSYITGPSVADTFSQIMCTLTSANSTGSKTPDKLVSAFDSALVKIGECQPKWKAESFDRLGAEFREQRKSILLHVLSDEGLWNSPPYKFHLLYKVRYAIDPHVTLVGSNCP